MKDKEKPANVVKWPTDAERVEAFEAYCLALGKVAHAWNYLHEKFAGLFAVVSATDHEIAEAIWHAVKNERSQRDMLLEAAKACVRLNKWPETPAAYEEIKWLVDRANGIGDLRNTVIHAPCSLYIGGGENGGHEMGAAFFNGNHQAKKLAGRRVLREFEWCERATETLSRYVPEVHTGIAFPGRYPWPTRPVMPPKPKA